MRASSLFLACAMVAAEAPKLTLEQRAELSAAAVKALRAEVEVRRLDEAYQQERTKRVATANEASQAYAALVKRLQALAPKGCTLNEDGDFKCAAEAANATPKTN